MTKVFLVGAGCGDPGLLTIKGKKAIEKADVIVYDWLASRDLLCYAKNTCEKIYVGKKAGDHTMPQEDINKLLIDKAKQGNVVVRLKGGDPYVFGRGGEEGETLYEAGIDFEVIPGITSAIGGLAYAGIPVTYRSIATSFHVITGHRQEGGGDLDYETYAKLNGTLVFLMGIGNIDNICSGLIKGGMPVSTPAAVVHSASAPYQKTAAGTLANISQLVKDEGITAPGIIVVGEVVTKRETLSFFERKPLFGKKVVITRARTQSSVLSERIEELGGAAIEMPMIETKVINSEELKLQIDRLSTYQYVIFTSENGVEVFFSSLQMSGKDARAFGGVKVVAIGSGTASALKRHGITADYIPVEFIGEAVVDMLKPELKPTDNVLLPRSENARTMLFDELSKICKVTEVKTYKIVRADEDYTEVKQQLLSGEIDYITFTSSSTVDNFAAELGSQVNDIIGKTKIISIGPLTSERIKSYALSVYAQADKYNIEGILEVLKSEY